jgi:hypothetical protein
MTLIGNLDGAIKAEVAHMLRRGDMNLADLLNDMLAAPPGMSMKGITDQAVQRARGWEGTRRARLTGFLTGLAADLAMVDLEDEAAVRGAY